MIGAESDKDSFLQRAEALVAPFEERLPMNRRKFVQAAALAPLVAASAPLSLASLAASEADKRIGAEAGRGGSLPADGGDLHARYGLTLDRVLHGDSPAINEEFLLDDLRPSAVRRFTEYSGDLSGRYIGALSTASGVYGTHFPKLDSLVEKGIALQKPDGYFGSAFHYEKPVDEDLALLWGNGRLLVGLLEYYKLKPTPAVLATCQRLGDWLVRIGPLMLSKEMRAEFGAQHFASSYICWMQQTEGLAQLYMVTKDERYRKLGEEIAAVIERRPSDHVHGYLTSLRGVMDLYKATGDAKLLAQCEGAWEDVERSEDALITGGVPEGWSPNGHRTEGCAEADWVRLNLALWKATGKTRYLACAERAVFNEFGFNQFATGDFGHRVYTETGFEAQGAARAWWCCTLHGLRAFPDVQASVFHGSEGGLYYDLPLDGRIETPELSAVAVSSLARDGKVKITITAAGKNPVKLRIRKVEWADEIEASLEGNGRLASLENGYFGMERTWVVGDIIAVKYAMKLRAAPSGKDRTSYSFGPWLLGAAATDNFHYFNEITADNRILGGVDRAQPAGEQPARPFAVPIAARVFRYAPAEYPVQPGTVTLHAIAEQAGQPTTSWELRFLTGEKG